MATYYDYLERESLIWSTPMKPQEKMLVLALNNFPQPTPWGKWRKEIAKMTSLPATKVERVREQLQSKGILKATRSGKGKTLVEICDEKLVPRM